MHADCLYIDVSTSMDLAFLITLIFRHNYVKLDLMASWKPSSCIVSKFTQTYVAVKVMSPYLEFFLELFLSIKKTF